MNYLIAVFPDRMKAEEAYTALETEGIYLKQVAIVGKGYQSADEFGLIDLKQQSIQRAIRMAYWVVPLGFVAGYGFDLITGLDTFNWAGEPGNHIIGGLAGAIGGAMGSYFVGGGVGLSFGSRDVLPYHNLVDGGKYLVIIQGSDFLKNKSKAILQRFEPENMQVYGDSYD